MRKVALVFCSLLLIAWGYFFCNTPLVSVVITTYNRAELVSKAIDSILGQTYKRLEVLIINDGSDDNTADVLAKYSKKDSRIRIITNNENKGIVKSRNIGLSEARGKYLVWQDDDDIAEKNKIAEQVKFMQKHRDVTILGTQISLLGNDRMIYLWPTEVNPDEAEIAFLIGRVPIALPTTIWRLDFIKKYQIKFDISYPVTEDLVIYDKILSHGGKIMTINETLYQYRLHYSNSVEYYKKIRKLQKEFYERRWNRFYPNEVYPKTQCERLKYIKEHNKYFSDDVVREMYGVHCQGKIYNPTSISFVVVYDDGVEEPIVVSKNNSTFYSVRFKKVGKVQKYSFDSIYILWEDEEERKEYKIKRAK